MQQTTRRILFYAFFLAFLVLGTSTVLYAQGWRFDIHTWSIKKIGGIFIRIHPRDAAISLDNVPVQNASWLLQNGTFINSLSPKTYSLTLRKEGFRPWTRHIAVAPSLVTEISNAVLVPSLAHKAPAPSSTIPSLAFSPTSVLAATSSSWSARAVNNARSGTSSIAFAETGRNGSRASSSVTLALESPVRSLAWNRRNMLGILGHDGTLLRYNPATQEQLKIADDVTNFSWNSDGDKVAALERRSLEIFDLDNPANYYRFNVRGIGDAERLLWYRDNTHLFIIYPDKTVFFDFDDANIENIIEVVPTNRVFYDENADTLYFIEQATSTIQALVFPG